MLKRVKWASLCALVLTLSLTALAQQPGRDIEKEKLFWQQLETIAPSAVENFKAATVALDKEDYAEAARLYQEVLKKAPDFDPALRRLGGALVFLGRVPEGVANLEKAIKLNRSAENLGSLAQALAYPGGSEDKASQADKQKALALAREAYALNKDENDAYYPLLFGQLALELRSENDFRNATQTLVAKHQDLMATHYFNAIRALNDEDWTTAEKEIKRAESMGLPADAVQAFLDTGVHSRAMVWSYTYLALYLVAAWAVGLVLLFISGKVLSSMTLRSIETADPNQPADSRQLSLRKIYRTLINVAGFYYYISIPVVIFLVVAVAGAVIYGFLMLGQIPIKLTLIIVVGVLVTVYQMIRSLFSRTAREDPGRALSQEEAPGLWALTRDVAEKVGTRPVDEIRLTPGTDLAVYERGSFRERMQDRAQRNLILGVGVLNGFSRNAFRAVLAHEYGHFRHRDTAGGDVALRVNSDMIRFANAMIRSGQATWWNIAFHFLRLYHFIFRRITHGATRLQEVLADRIAVRLFGAKAFEEGLSHAIRRDVEFSHLATAEIRRAVDTKQAMQNLYELSEIKTETEKTIAAKVHAAINRETTEDDTHPSPADRFRLASRITSEGETPASGTVWEFFTDRQALTAEMSAVIDKQLGRVVLRK